MCVCTEVYSLQSSVRASLQSRRHYTHLPGWETKAGRGDQGPVGSLPPSPPGRRSVGHMATLCCTFRSETFMDSKEKNQRKGCPLVTSWEWKMSFFSFNLSLHFRPHLLFQFCETWIPVIPAALAVSFSLSRDPAQHNLTHPYSPDPHTLSGMLFFRTPVCPSLFHLQPQPKLPSHKKVVPGPHDNYLSLCHGPIQLESSQYICNKLPCISL